MESDKEKPKEPVDNPMPSKIGEIVLMTDHIPTKKEILEAKKQQLREMGMIK